HFFRLHSWTALCACLIGQVILQMRLYALYYLNKKVLAFMVGMFVISSAASAAIMGTVLQGVTGSAHPLAGMTFCVPFGVHDYIFAFWIPLVSFESLLCGLALYRALQQSRASGSFFHSSRHLVDLLIRDSLLYFLVMFATYLTNILISIFAPVMLTLIPFSFSIALSCCLGNRLILDVRKKMRSNEHNVQSTQHQARKEGNWRMY
ncbi:hypothetical protein C8R47DRAFT_990200, partial [Mycena vitilis]